MADLASARIKMVQDDTDFKGSLSSLFFSKIGSNINALIAGFGNADIQVFTTSGTWTKPAGFFQKVLVITTAGGGKGGNASTGSAGGSDAAGGGGAGSTNFKLIDQSNLLSSETVTVGTAANISYFGSHVTSTPGLAAGNALGATRISAGGVGGVSSTGDINIIGGMGKSHSRQSGGQGGASFWGDGATGGNFRFGAGGVYNGVVGVPWGSGGGGAASSGSGNSATGGNGAPGVVIVVTIF